MPNTADIRKTLSDTSPLYAVAGAGDLAVEKLRELPSILASLRPEPKTVQDRVTGTVNTIQDEARALPERAQSIALTSIGKATEAYEDLTERGKNVVGRIRRQKSTREARSQAQTAVEKIKATQTSAKRSAANTQRQAKGAATSTVKAAKAAEKAAEDAAGKVGS